MKEASFTVQHPIHDHMLHTSGIDTLLVTKELLASAGGKRYMEYLDEMRKVKTKSAHA